MTTAPGVAALLELARLLKSVRPAEGLEMRLVFYVNEEFALVRDRKNGQSRARERPCREGREVVAMLSLETIRLVQRRTGAASATRSPSICSTRPPAISSAFVAKSALAKSPAPRDRLVQAPRGFSLGGRSGLESIAGVSWSDQWAYWNFGWPAVMVTDTAPFPLPHYHTLRDTPDKLDYDGLARWCWASRAWCAIS